MLSIGAFNALLKTLEEPPEYVIFILATTEAHKIPITILSRCQRYDFKRISIETIADRLKELMVKEQVEVEDRAIRYVAKAADGSMRDALSLLDQCIAFYLGQKLTYDHVLEVLGAVDTDVFSKLLRQILERNVAAVLETVEELVMQGRELTQLTNDFTWYLRNLLLMKSSDNMEDVLDVSTENMRQLKEEAEMVEGETLFRYIRIFSELSNQMRYAVQKRILLEVALIKLCRPQMETNQDSILDRVRTLEERVESGDFGGPVQGNIVYANEEKQAEPKERPKLEKAIPEDIREVVKNFRSIVNEAGGLLKGYLKGARLSPVSYTHLDVYKRQVYNGEEIITAKSKGRLKVLSELTHGGDAMPGTLGIGHTRWATHGEPSDVNAHPHMNKNESIVVVHNGIIENYLKLKKKLERKGYEFISETDTEVIAHLLDYYYKGNPLEAVTKIMHRMEGSYALGIIFKEHPDQLYAVRKDSPLIVGHTDGGNILASDVPAVLKYTRDVYFIENEEIVRMTDAKMEFFTVDEEPLEKESVRIEWDVNAAEKGGYDHFMLKEMYEQPKAIIDTFSPRLKNDGIEIEELNMSDEEIKAIRKLVIVACGSAYHTGVTSKYIFEGLARVPVEVDLASEFRYRDPIFEEGTLVVVISQSGETADTLAALRESQKRGARVLGIVNVVGSSIAREADNVMYTWAGPEIAVATTKMCIRDRYICKR